jgi:hypothetical protein
MHHMDHLCPADSESGAGGNRSGSGRTQPSHRRERHFSHKVACGGKRDGSFLPGSGNNCDFCTALVKTKKTQSAGSPCEKKASFGANWMILRPRPALARKAATSNRGFSGSTIEGPSCRCSLCRVIAGGVRGRIALSLTKQVRDQ